MQALLKQFGAGDAKPVRVAESADARARLRSLGYVSGTVAPKAAYTEADDPKRLIALDRQTDELITRYLQGDVRGAIAMAESLTKQRPDMAVTWTQLAFLYNQAGDHASAVRAIRRALDLNPGQPRCRVAVCRLLHRSGSGERGAAAARAVRAGSAARLRRAQRLRSGARRR
jgi:cytochrome c-type biogenesis protein CcmH/NrfG